MQMFAGDPEFESDTVTSAVGFLAQRANVCVKVLDRDGRIVAVNRRGLELLETTAEAVCNAIWTEFWDGATRQEAEACVKRAFAGEAGTFTGVYRIGDRDTQWEIEAFPLEWSEGAVTRVLVLSSLLTGTANALPDADMTRKVSDLLHTFSNMASVAAGGARLLKRGLGAEETAQVAEQLNDAAERAERTLAEFSRILGRGSRAG
ncbi:PAS domain-containing protein [Rhodobacterales bacterium HKCCE2091]|nr:PAS domain-containing protein [Rhodobacterales bacterium HKCCE2091]